MQRISCGCALAMLVGIFVSSFAAQAACPLRDAALDARRNADTVYADYLKVKIDPALDAKLNQFFAKVGWLNDEPDIDQMNKDVRDIFTPDEITRVQPYMKAYKAKERADKAARAAEKAWYAEFIKKDEALTKAEKTFEEEQAWLTEMKKDLVGRPVDDAYLTRAALIVYRLTNSYNEMIKSLEIHRECYPDARGFIEDLEKRLKKLKALEKQIADLRAVRDKPPGDSMPPKPADPAVPPATAPVADAGRDPANDQEKLGDWWVCDGPEDPKTQGTGINATKSGASWSKKTDKGDATANVKVVAGPPLRIRAGQAIKVVLSAESNEIGSAWGDWYTNNFAINPALADHSPTAFSHPDNNAAKKGPHNIAVFHHVFAPHNDTYPCWIEARMSQWGGDYLPSVVITWRYRKE